MTKTKKIFSRVFILLSMCWVITITIFYVKYVPAELMKGMNIVVCCFYIDKLAKKWKK